MRKSKIWFDAPQNYLPLLNDFPCSTFSDDRESMSSWCGWHTDHGSLTGEQTFTLE